MVQRFRTRVRCWSISAGATTTHLQSKVIHTLFVFIYRMFEEKTRIPLFVIKSIQYRDEANLSVPVFYWQFLKSVHIFMAQGRNAIERYTLFERPVPLRIAMIICPSVRPRRFEKSIAFNLIQNGISRSSTSRHTRMTISFTASTRWNRPARHKNELSLWLDKVK